MNSLYLHIPFCRKKCHYCSFCSIATGSENYMPYVAALKKELFDLAAKIDHRSLKSLFIGGGTPTVLPSSVLAELVGYCLQLFPPIAEAEISVEVNPGTVNQSSLRALYAAGVNRLSMGFQSLNDLELLILGRLHTSAEAKEAMQAAKNAGFSNINLDLMYGLPGQTVNSWRATLAQAISLCPQHLSLYQLTIEEGTPFHQAVASGRIVLPGEDDILLMDEVTDKLSSHSAFNQYEISNYAKPGYECNHNINYWQNGDYLACGASAVSCVQGVREKRIANPLEYVRRITKGHSVIVESECLGLDASFRESVIMGLRMNKGVSLQLLEARYHIDIVKYYGIVLEKLINLQLVELTTSQLRLTPKGRPLANWVMAELV